MRHHSNRKLHPLPHATRLFLLLSLTVPPLHGGQVKCDTCRCWIPEDGIQVISNLYKCIATETCARNAVPGGKRRCVKK